VELHLHFPYTFMAGFLDKHRDKFSYAGYTSLHLRPEERNESNKHALNFAVNINWHLL
jgi:hypothetical protein